jgi:hypothetical protein
MLNKNIFIIIGLLILISFGVILGLNLKPKPQPTTLKPEASTIDRSIPETKEEQRAEEIDTSDWKIYQDEKYGFEVKYPAHWIAKPIVWGPKGVLISNPQLPGVGEISVIYLDEYHSSDLARKAVLGMTPNQKDIIVSNSYLGRLGESPGAISILLNVDKKVYSIDILPLHKVDEKTRNELKNIFWNVVQSFKIK